MRKKILVFVLCCIIFTATVSPSYAAGDSNSGVPVFRGDYVYNQATDAYYKLHLEPESWERAQEICTEENACLLSLSPADLLFGHSLMKKYPDVAKEVYVVNDGKNHQDQDEEEDDYTEDVDEDYENAYFHRYPEASSQRIGYNSKCNAFTMRGKLVSLNCYYTRAFICKVARVDLRYNEDCKLYDSDYKYNANLGSCYKFKVASYTWGQALAYCANEGAHLTIINSQAESDYMKSELMGLKQEYRMSYPAFHYYHSGFRRYPELGDPVFRTIYNQTLAEAGFDVWAPGEPNNFNGENENCGTIFRDTGTLNDVSCVHVNGFVCEKEIEKVA